MKQLVCDACNKICKPGSEFSMFIFTVYGLVNGTLTPRVQQEDYCSSCTDTIKRVIENLKNGNSTDKK